MDWKEIAMERHGFTRAKDGFYRREQSPLALMIRERLIIVCVELPFSDGADVLTQFDDCGRFDLWMALTDGKPIAGSGRRDLLARAEDGDGSGRTPGTEKTTTNSWTR